MKQPICPLQSLKENSTSSVLENKYICSVPDYCWHRAHVKIIMQINTWLVHFVSEYISELIGSRSARHTFTMTSAVTPWQDNPVGSITGHGTLKSSRPKWGRIGGDQTTIQCRCLQTRWNLLDRFHPTGRLQIDDPRKCHQKVGWLADGICVVSRSVNGRSLNRPIPSQKVASNQLYAIRDITDMVSLLPQIKDRQKCASEHPDI